MTELASINEAMSSRISRIIELALNKQAKAIILGAFGCGVFENKPEVVSKMFAVELNKRADVLNDMKIIFAIYDKWNNTTDIFSKELNYKRLKMEN